jgi:sodium transport system permease protein
MYPLFVGVGVLFVSAIKEKKLVVAVAGSEHLPTADVTTPAAPAAAAGGPAAFARQFSCTFPPLLVDGRFPARYLASDPDGGTLLVSFVPVADEGLLDRREADAALVIDPEIGPKLDRRERPTLRILGREGEENSKLAVRRLSGVLKNWSEDLKAARFARDGHPAEYDSPIEVKDPQSDKPPGRKTVDELRDVLVKVIPFLLVMWMLTGSIYPAIDMTAGEKERGTMETLLISPAERTEIVAGKFLAVMAMGFGTAVWNVLLMVAVVTIAPLLAPSIAGYSLLSVAGLAACVLAALPLSMLIAACSLSLGVFARSTKEGTTTWCRCSSCCCRSRTGA